MVVLEQQAYILLYEVTYARESRLPLTTLHEETSNQVIPERQ